MPSSELTLRDRAKACWRSGSKRPTRYSVTGAPCSSVTASTSLAGAVSRRTSPWVPTATFSATASFQRSFGSLARIVRGWVGAHRSSKRPSSSADLV